MDRAGLKRTEDREDATGIGRTLGERERERRVAEVQWGLEEGWRTSARKCLRHSSDGRRKREEMAQQREEEEDKFYRSSKANLPHSHTDQIEDAHINICPLIPQFTLSTLFSWSQVTVVIETIHVERCMSSWAERKRDMTGFSLCLCLSLSVANAPFVPFWSMDKIDWHPRVKKEEDDDDGRETQSLRSSGLT